MDWLLKGGILHNIDFYDLSTLCRMCEREANYQSMKR